MPFDTGVEFGTTVGVLLRARHLIEQGWVQDEFGSQKQGGFCAVGGVRHDAAKGAHADATSYLYAALPWKYRFFGFNRWKNLSLREARIAAYNDASMRTRAQILALYDRAIVLCRADAENQHSQHGP